MNKQQAKLLLDRIELVQAFIDGHDLYTFENVNGQEGKWHNVHDFSIKPIMDGRKYKIVYRQELKPYTPEQAISIIGRWVISKNDINSNSRMVSRLSNYGGTINRSDYIYVGKDVLSLEILFKNFVFDKNEKGKYEVCGAPVGQTGEKIFEAVKLE
jgi:hypothetical protein